MWHHQFMVPRSINYGGTKCRAEISNRSELIKFQNGFSVFLSQSKIFRRQPRHLIVFITGFPSYRSSRPVVFCKMVFLKISQNSHEKTYARVSFLIKLQACNFIKKETLAQMFSCEFCEVVKNTFFIEHLWWLLLQLSSEKV